MKKKIFGGILAVAIAAVAAVNVNFNNESEDALSALSLANVEALASGENGSPCGGPKTYGTCQSTNTVNCKDTSGCQ